MNWNQWITVNWTALKNGNKLFVRQSELSHPRERSDLFRPGVGFPDGQTCDYMMPFEDGSRLHVQCYVDRAGVALFRIHRDRWDPDRDLVSFVLHGLFETPAGPALAGVAVIAALRS